ncbi:hypothetical protein LOK74_08225 [Brevibacillus humidisoli]|uniref:hypothetical protein n=1 Tax=Brevibacillus humidisoli TaxID=2895522 RepID=UPI001E460561|nr:hypothetical protein [Brevibacillus humidisoli]UFJ42460.1 hypothetical protein LOK74_08225 [Brevibacillus humidisoli]
MSYSVQVIWSPAIELVQSLSAYLNKSTHSLLHLGNRWVETTRQELTDGFADKLESKPPKLWDPLYLLIWQQLLKEQVTADAYLDWLESQDADQITTQLSPYVKKFPKQLRQTLGQQIELLRLWNDQYFSRMDRTVLTQLEEHRQKAEALLATMPGPELIEQVTNGLRFEPVDGLTQVILCPQYHYQPISVYCCFQGVTFCMYAAGRTGQPGTLGDQTTEAALSDSLRDTTCLKILRVLDGQTKPCSFTQLSKTMQLDKDTTFDAVFKLRLAGLIRTHVHTERLFLYSVRREAPAYQQYLQLSS